MSNLPERGQTSKSPQGLFQVNPAWHSYLNSLTTQARWRHPSSVRILLSSAVVGFCLLLAGCYGCGLRQNPEQLKERTAQTTAELKSDAKAVAQGVREGWSRDKPLDINRATQEQLASLPGISMAEADRIIANRPYENTGDLVRKRVLPQREFDQIKDRVVVKR